jgi:hypothetical protein
MIDDFCGFRSQDLTAEGAEIVSEFAMLLLLPICKRPRAYPKTVENRG